MKKIILKHALLNAQDFEGKANPKAVLGKVLAENSKLKKDIPKLMKDINEIVKKVNVMDVAEQKKEIKKFGKIVRPVKKQREGLPELPNAKKGKVVTRFPPYPSGALHIGNMKPLLISYEYAKMYDGKFVVRIDDTDPDPTKVKKENVEYIKKDLQAMNVKPDKFYMVSSRFDRMYELAKQLLKKGKAYTCTCPLVLSNKNKSSVGKIACECRNNSVEDNLNIYEMMFKKLKQGDAVVRLKTDIADKNPALRDPVMLRIKEGVNPTTGKEHRVYPVYNFSTAIGDHDDGITHILRGTEHAFNTIIQKYFYEAFGWKKLPTVINFGFLYMEGEKIHKRFIRDAIAKGKFTGWDDARLGQYGLVRALLKRGIQPEAIKNMIIEMGVTPQTVRFKWDKLYTENRKLIDKKSNRYFFVSDPIEIKLDKVPMKETKAPTYPGKKTYRKIPVAKKVYVDNLDFISNREKEVRLMHLCNVYLDKSSKVVEDSIKNIPKIHWVSAKKVKVKLIMPDGKEMNGFAEPEIKKVKLGDTVQFERIGFARLDKKNVYYYSHQ
ncbi:MAG: glutamate--tRNA ligase [Candidatus Aenigmarchaeota archaeon]|nr:glutamate--tRNA ligase [Candidatus Aenigmarchaeota archaeon]